MRAVVSYVSYQRENNEGGGRLCGLSEGEQLGRWSAMWVIRGRTMRAVVGYVGCP